MIEKKFEEIMKSNIGCAVIMAGSPSDSAHIEKIIESLKKYDIPFQARVCSAHKQPDELKKIIDEYNAVIGSVVYSAVAGGTDALSGTLSFHALGPVISCPPDFKNESVFNNPAGSSNWYIAKPENVGRFVAQMYAGINPKFRFLLSEYNSRKINELKAADTDFKEKYMGC